jgi:hypothetical protein
VAEAGALTLLVTSMDVVVVLVAVVVVMVLIVVVLALLGKEIVEALAAVQTKAEAEAEVKARLVQTAEPLMAEMVALVLSGWTEIIMLVEEALELFREVLVQAALVVAVIST